MAANSFNQTDFTAFRHDKSFLPTNTRDVQRWIGGYQLGLGGQGMVGPWVGVNSRNRVTKRIAIKRSRIPASVWRAQRNWVPHAGIATGVPIGTHAHMLLSAHSDRHFLKYIDHRIEAQEQQVLTFTEFCSHGSLGDVLDQLRRFNIANRENPRHLPESWLWFIFEALARANVDMASIGQRADAGEIDHFAVHCDLKPDNVFLAEPDPHVHQHRFFPIPKVLPLIR